MRQLNRARGKTREHGISAEDGHSDHTGVTICLGRGMHLGFGRRMSGLIEAKRWSAVQTARTLQKVASPAPVETVVEVAKDENDRLSPDDRAAITTYAARATWPAGFVVYESGARADGVFIVLGGCVVLRNRVKAGRGFVSAMAGVGETFGSEGLARRGRYATDARADGETETLHLSSAAFRAFMREQPHHAITLVGQIMLERATLLQRMRELATLGVEQRLILSLLRLARSRAYTSDSGHVTLGTTQYRLLCEMVGATRESVSLVLGRLAREGLVTRDGARYIIAPAEALEQRLESPPMERERPLALSHGEGRHAEF
jgi:CRP-like cAMP-binding protein